MNFERLWCSLALMLVSTVVGACDSRTGEILQGALPVIYDVEIPSGPYFTTLNWRSLTLSATYEANAWTSSDTIKAFGYGATPEQTRGLDATMIIVNDDDCVPIPDSGAERCTVEMTAGLGTHYYQWFFERVGGGDIVEAPIEPTMFILASSHSSDGGEENNDEPIEDPLAQLELRVPQENAVCAGTYSGSEENDGDTNVRFSWHEAGGVTDTELEGDFQIRIEPAGSDGCEQAEQIDNLGPIDDPIADIFEPDRCILQPIHINSTAFSLSALTKYQWQVRRITGEDLGPFTQPSLFTTAGYVTETPRFIEPNGNDLTNYPIQAQQLTLGTAVSKVVDVRWTPVGCNPHGYTANLFEDGESNWSDQEIGWCELDFQSGERICEADFAVQAGSSYKLELNQQTDFGDIDAVLNFSVAEQP